MLQYNPTVTGSLQVSGDITGTINGINITGLSQSLSTQLVTVQSSTASSDAKFETLSGVTSSALTRLTNIESKSASVDISISNINSITASNIARLSNLETKSSSVDISLSSINSKTGSYATTGSNSFYGTQVFSGSVYIANDLIVQGSSSIQYISASSVSLGTNIIQLNTANPSVRFAGLTMIDSGSVGGSGSFLYDSLQDEFIFVHRGNGANITSSHFVLGPETYDGLGNETYLTCNRLSKGTGKEHLVDSCIFDNGTTICFNTPTGSFLGKLGIGTTSMPHSLTITTPSGVGSGIQINKSGYTTSFLGDGGSSYPVGILSMYECGNQKVQIYAGGTSYFTGGNVGIGVSSPVSTSLTGSMTIYKSYNADQANVPSTTAQAYYGNQHGLYLFGRNSGLTIVSANSEEGSIKFGNACSTAYATIGTLTGNSTVGGDMYFRVGSDCERMRITSGGYVGIGTASPDRALDVTGLSAFRQPNATNSTTLSILQTAAGGNGFNDTGLVVQTSAGDGTTKIAHFYDYNAGTPISRMAILKGGNVGIGCATPSYLLHIPQGNNLFLSNLFIAGTASNPILSSGATGGSMYLQGGGAGEGNIYLQGAGSGGNGYIEFRTNGSLRMTISSGGNIGAPSGTNIYNASDIRLKQNVTTIVDGLDKIMGLNPVKFNWINNFVESEEGKDMLGFVAQEVQEVIPEAVENFSGNSITIGETIVENPLRVNEKFIIPVLVKAIQEQQYKIALLESCLGII